MNSKGKSFTKNERIIVLSFDSRLAYDQSDDKVLGPFKNVQVLMARSLLCKWKQPIYYDFDKNITKNILYEIIMALENISYEVVGMVSDMGPENIGLWKELNVTHENTSFENLFDK